MENVENRKKIGRAGSMNPPHAPHAPWPRVKLGEVVTETHERITSSSISPSQYISTENMLKNAGGIVDASAVPKDTSLVSYSIGDVLISNIRPYFKKIWLADRNGGCSSDVVVFRKVRSGITSEYLRAVLSQDAFFDHVMLRASGTKMPRGNRQWMLEFNFPLPPLAEQKKIVAKLERELAAVDAMEKKFEEMEKTAETAFKAELKEAFDEVSRGGAEKRRLGDVCEILDSQRVPITKKDRTIGEIPYYGATGIVDYVANWIFDERLVLLGEDGAKWGAGDNSAFIIEGKTWVNNHAHVLRPNKSLFDSFLVYYLNCSDLGDFITGVTVPKLNQQRMSEIELPLPTLQVQKLIVARLDAARSRKEKLVSAAQKGALAAALLRKALLKEAFE